MDNGGPPTRLDDLKLMAENYSKLERENIAFRERNQYLERELSKLQNYLNELRLQ